MMFKIMVPCFQRVPRSVPLSYTFSWTSLSICWFSLSWSLLILQPSDSFEWTSLLEGGFPGGSVVKKKKKSACHCRRRRRHRLDPWVAKIPWKRKCNPLQYLLLGTPMERGVWWATVHRVVVHRVTESDTNKWLNTQAPRREPWLVPFRSA